MLYDFQESCQQASGGRNLHAEYAARLQQSSEAFADRDAAVRSQNAGHQTD